MSTYKLKDVFPIVKHVIREINDEGVEWADRNMIAQRLLQGKRIQKLIPNTDSAQSDYEKKIGNMVDWFSAHYTQRTDFMDDYLNEFSRERKEMITPNGQKISVWGYKVLTISIAEEVDAAEIDTYNESGVSAIYINKYERSRQARDACIAYHGWDCKVCSLDFNEAYPGIGKEFIHVHHLTPISQIGKNFEIDPVRDLIPICPNCHAMIHRPDEMLTVDELRDIISKRKYS